MTTTYGHLSNPNTHRMATNCCMCGTQLLDAKSVELGIGPVCRKNSGFSDLYKTLDESARKATNALIHRAGITCEASSPDIKEILDIVQEIELLGFTQVADKVRTRFALVRMTWVLGAAKYRWDWRNKMSVDTGETHDVLRVWTPYSPEFVQLRRDRNIEARPVKVDKEFFWEFPKSCAGKAYKLLVDVFPGALAHGDKGYFIIK